jgi:molybdopterin synthase catalytic subunit
VDAARERVVPGLAELLGQVRRKVGLGVEALDLDARVGEAAGIVRPDDRRDGGLVLGGGGDWRRIRTMGAMEVTVRLFAQLRERAGAGELSLELPDGASVADALERLEGLAEGLPLVMAVNRDYAPRDRVLSSGDELALIPPVSGGADPHARVREEPLSIAAVAALVRDPRAGAVVTFEGVTREVERLEYEAYREMAEERMAAIAGAAVEAHGLCAAAVEHRVGSVPLSEPSVIVAASAPHRGEAFAGAREIIDRVKAEAPIWKKEVEAGEERWVEGELPG